VVARAIIAGLKITRKQTKPIAAPSSDYGSDFDEETVHELLLRTGAVLDIDSKRDTISRLPDELIVYIAAQMNSGAEVNALARTNRRLFLCVDDYLYQRDAQRPTAWALNRAIKRGEGRTVAKSVEAGARITIETLDIPEKTNEGMPIVKLLLELGNIDSHTASSRRWTPLWYAVDVGYDAFVKSHLDSDPAELGHRDSLGVTLLCHAAYRGHESTVRLLLGYDSIDVHAKDSFGQSPFTLAVLYGREAVAKVLLGSGEVNVNSADYKELLHSAAWIGWPSIAKLLLDAGLIDCDTQKEDGMTPLSRAVSQKCEPIIRLLLDTGRVDINLPDNEGHTSLWYAVFKGNGDIVKFLLDAGSIDLCSRDHLKNLMAGLKKSRKSTFKLLQEYGVGKPGRAQHIETI
jgi:ankyrin repeat protein